MTRHHWRQAPVDWDGVKAQVGKASTAERPPLHAPDPAGKAAHDAAMMGSALQFSLLAASSPLATREQRAEAYADAFTAWPKLCRAMAALGQLAPASREAGEAWDAALREWAETRPQGEPT